MNKNGIIIGSLAVLALIVGVCCFQQANKPVNDQNAPYALSSAEQVPTAAPLPTLYPLPPAQQSKVVENSVVVEKTAPLTGESATQYDRTRTLTAMGPGTYDEQVSTPRNVQESPQIAQMYAPMPQARYAPVPQAVQYAPTRRVYSRTVVKTKRYRKHRSTGKVHVVRAVKHAALFTAKLPFKLRP
ncbi:MAG: hypothetical protein K2X81_13725 [Candidatus Obscuribacterales bacterium]|nr:hypothetical protein [Candidatus Obscuribacterales bacterium]